MRNAVFHRAAGMRAARGGYVRGHVSWPRGARVSTARRYAGQRAPFGVRVRALGCSCGDEPPRVRRAGLRRRVSGRRWGTVSRRLRMSRRSPVRTTSPSPAGESRARRRERRRRTSYARLDSRRASRDHLPMDPRDAYSNPGSDLAARAEIHDERLRQAADARRLVKEAHQEDVEYNGARPTFLERLRARLRGPKPGRR